MAEKQLQNGVMSVECCLQNTLPMENTFLGCSLCKEHYREPKILPCLHTFCRHCLDAYTPPHSLSVMCPTCRQQSIVPPEGVSGLQDSGFVLRLMEFVERCQKCAECIGSPSVTCAEHCGVDEQELTVLPLVCRSHNSEVLRELCHDCETIFCGFCSEHTEHHTEPLTDAAVSRQHDKLFELLQHTVDHPVAEVLQSLNTILAVVKELSDNHATSRQEVGQIFDNLLACIERKRQATLSEIDRAFETKHTVLKQQVKELSHLLVAMTACCQFTRRSADVPATGAQQVLIASKELTDRLASLSPMPSIPPAENDCLKFIVAPEERDAFENLVGELGDIATGGATAVETTVTGEGLKECWSNQPSTVIITPRDHNGKVVKIAHSALSATITPSSKNSNKTLPAAQVAFVSDISSNADGSYELTYVVYQPGVFLLDICLNSRPVRGSPFRLRAHHEVKGSVEALQRRRSDSRLKSSSTSGGGSSVGGSGSAGLKRPASSQSHGSQQRLSSVDDDLLLRIGSQGRNKGQFMNPQGVAFCQLTSTSNSDPTPVVHHRVLIADSNSQCVQVFSATTGECLLKFGIRGRQASQLQRPTGIAVTANGNYLVSDYDNKWVGVFSPEGKYINRIGTGKLLGPKGVCCDANGRIIIVDNRGSAVYVFQSNGRIIHKFGSRGSADPRHLAGPHFCAVTPSSRDVVVTDFHNHCVKVFDIDSGSLKFTFGSAGEGNGQFGAPTGVAVDRQGNILVADWGNSRIQVFDAEGSFLSFVNTSADPLYGPQGLAVTDDGNIIVADSGNHCFKIYKHLLQ